MATHLYDEGGSPVCGYSPVLRGGVPSLWLLTCMMREGPQFVATHLYDEGGSPVCGCSPV